MSFNGFCRKCEAGEPHGICCEPWWDEPATSPAPALNILREQAEHRRAMLLDKYAHRIKDMSAAGNGRLLLMAEISHVLGELLAEAIGPNRAAQTWTQADEADHVAHRQAYAEYLAMASPTPDMWDGIERGIRVEDGSIPSYVPPSATSQQFAPAPRSCPTCGPCPGGPSSTPLNETDKSCWRCGRTDLS